MARPPLALSVHPVWVRWPGLWRSDGVSFFVDLHEGHGLASHLGGDEGVPLELGHKPVGLLWFFVIFHDPPRSSHSSVDIIRLIRLWAASSGDQGACSGSTASVKLNYTDAGPSPTLGR